MSQSYCREVQAQWRDKSLEEIPVPVLKHTRSCVGCWTVFRDIHNNYVKLAATSSLERLVEGYQRCGEKALEGIDERIRDELREACKDPEKLKRYQAEILAACVDEDPPDKEE